MSEKIAAKPEERMRELFFEFARGLSYDERGEKTFDTLALVAALNDASWSQRGPLASCKEAVIGLFGPGRIEEHYVENFLDYWRRERFIKAAAERTRDGRQIWIIVEAKP
jgi:hypothetical protein